MIHREALITPIGMDTSKMTGDAAPVSAHDTLTAPKGVATVPCADVNAGISFAGGGGGVGGGGGGKAASQPTALTASLFVLPKHGSCPAKGQRGSPLASWPSLWQKAEGVIEQWVLPTHAATAIEYARVSLHVAAALKPASQLPDGVPQEANSMDLITPLPALQLICRSRSGVHVPETELPHSSTSPPRHGCAGGGGVGGEGGGGGGTKRWPLRK